MAGMLAISVALCGAYMSLRLLVLYSRDVVYILGSCAVCFSSWYTKFHGCLVQWWNLAQLEWYDTRSSGEELCPSAHKHELCQVAGLVGRRLDYMPRHE